MRTYLSKKDRFTGGTRLVEDFDSLGVSDHLEVDNVFISPFQSDRI